MTNAKLLQKWQGYFQVIADGDPDPAGIARVALSCVPRAKKKAKPRNEKNAAYLRWVRQQECCALVLVESPCFGRVQAHHAGERGNGQKAADRTAVPLCYGHHDRSQPKSVHAMGPKFWPYHGLEKQATISFYNDRYDAEFPERNP